MNKKLIAILTLAIFALTLMPMGAFASSVKVNTVGPIPTITSTGTTDSLPNIRIDEDVEGNFKLNDVVVVTLPSGMEWPAALVGSTATVSGAGGTATIERQTSTVAHVTITALTGGNKRFLNIDFGNIDIKNTSTTGEVILDAPGTTIPTTTISVANGASRSVTATMLSAPTKGTSGEFGTIRLTENSAGALRNGNKVTLKVAGDFSFIKTPAAGDSMQNTLTGTRSLELDPVVPVAADDDKVFEYTVGTISSGGPGIVDIPVWINVGNDAAIGDITVSFSGELSGDIVVGKYADFGVTVTAAASKDLESGKDNQTAANVTIEDQVSGSLIAGRTVVVTLPNNTRFTGGNAPAPTVTNGTLSPGQVSNEGRTVTYTVTASTGKMKIEFKDPKIDVATNFKGDVGFEVRGTAGATGTVMVANVKPVVAIEAVAANIKIGVQNQAINDMYITEAKKEVLPNGKVIRLTLPAGATFAATPTVEVLEGNVTIDTVTRPSGDNNTAVEIKIKSSSTVPSKLKVSGLSITTNRSIPEGDLNVTVAGDAINKNTGWKTTATLGSFKIATVTTPAEDGVVQPVVMTVGSTVYTVDGVEMTMDVAPYVKTGRTFFPVRFVASAVGISADNVVWDSAQRTVTIFRGNRIVQVTIGSTTMLVNGIPLTMDVAPEITAGRTMLPIRFVAQGLNVNVTWDAATQTVTLN